MLKGICTIATLTLTALADATEKKATVEPPAMTRQEAKEYQAWQEHFNVNDRTCEKGQTRNKMGHDVFGRAIFHVQNCPMCQTGYKYRGLQEWMQYI